MGMPSPPKGLRISQCVSCFSAPLFHGMLSVGAHHARRTATGAPALFYPRQCKVCCFPLAANQALPVRAAGTYSPVYFSAEQTNAQRCAGMIKGCGAGWAASPAVPAMLIRETSLDVSGGTPEPTCSAIATPADEPASAPSSPGRAGACCWSSRQQQPLSSAVLFPCIQKSTSPAVPDLQLHHQQGLTRRRT